MNFFEARLDGDRTKCFGPAFVLIWSGGGTAGRAFPAIVKPLVEPHNCAGGGLPPGKHPALARASSVEWGHGVCQFGEAGRGKRDQKKYERPKCQATGVAAGLHIYFIGKVPDVVALN